VVVFVLDAAQDGFHQVLHGDDARGAAVFVHHHGHVQLFGGELGEQVLAAGGFGHKHGLAHQRLEVKGGAVALAQQGQQVLDVQDAADVVDGLLVHRDAGVAGFDGHLQQVLQVGVVFNGKQVGAVGHDLHHRAVVKLKDVVDHFPLGLFDGAVFVAHVHHHADLFLGDLLGVFRLDSEDPQRYVDRGVEQPDEGRGDAGENVDRPGRAQRDRFGIAKPEMFRNLFAEQQRKEGERHRDEDYDQTVKFAVGKKGDAVPGEPDGEGGGETLRGERARQESGKSHSQLYRCEETARIPGQGGEPSAAPASFLIEAAHRCRFQRNQRHFRRGETGIEKNQETQNQQLQKQ